MTGRCDVCGREGHVFVACSACGAETHTYCLECLHSGAEPWSALVSYISIAGFYPDDINENYRDIVRATCARLGRTEEEFAADVKQEIENEPDFFEYSGADSADAPF